MPARAETLPERKDAAASEGGASPTEPHVGRPPRTLLDMMMNSGKRAKAPEPDATPPAPRAKKAKVEKAATRPPPTSLAKLAKASAKGRSASAGPARRPAPAARARPPGP